ncbi:MAG: cytidylyltransferase domain-containing protein [Solirubrobacterales bacterium]
MFKQDQKIVATIEARMTSSRLPGKVLMDLAGKPSLQQIVERLKRSRYLDDVVVATTVNATDDPIVELCREIGCTYYRGSEEDVLLRVLKAAKSAKADIIVEITGDCPVIDWRHVDYLIEMFYSGTYDYAANIIERTFPRGFDTQVFPVAVLDRVNQLTDDQQDHEHVSLYIYHHPETFRLVNWTAPPDLHHPEMEITLDTLEDYRLIQAIYDELYPGNPDFSAGDVVGLLLRKPELLEIISNVRRKTPHQ